MASFALGFPGTTPSTFPGSNSDGSFNWQNFIVSQENLVANTFLANQAITSPRASSITLNPNGTLSAAGGGAGVVGAGASIFSSPLVWIIGLVVLVLLLRR